MSYIGPQTQPVVISQVLEYKIGTAIIRSWQNSLIGSMFSGIGPPIVEKARWKLPYLGKDRTRKYCFPREIEEISATIDEFKDAEREVYSKSPFILPI